MKIVIIVAALVCTSFGAVPRGDIEHESGKTIAVAKCAIPNFENAFRNSKAVFVGKVTNVTKVGDDRVFEFAVEKYWKGAVKKRMTVSFYETTRYQAWFKLGETYLMFAGGDPDGQLTVGRCSRSKDLSQAGEDLKKLGKAKQPSSRQGGDNEK